MKQTYARHGWLFASICFFGLACLGAALDEPRVPPPSPPRQPSKPDVPPPKVAQPSPQNNSGASRRVPELVASTEIPDARVTNWLSASDSDEEMVRAEAKGYYPVRIEGRFQDGIIQYRVFFKVMDASIDSYRYSRNMEGWRYNEQHEYYEKGYRSVNSRYSKIIESHQSFSGPEGERHQAVWVVIK